MQQNKFSDDDIDFFLRLVYKTVFFKIVQEYAQNW
jgi:hypothetical protein